MAISKKLRFEVFKRDGFKCQYCGKTPPAVVLEADHVDPKSKGGSDDINNLITACFDCNRGKSNRKLSQIPSTLIDNKEAMEEKEEQYRAYKRVLKKIEKRKNAEIKQVHDIYQKYFPEYYLKDRFLKGSLSTFLSMLTVYDVCNAMEIACGKFSYGRYNEEDKAIKYFCGICWSRIREKGGVR